MLNYILIFILNLLILILLFRRDALFSLFLSEKNTQTTIKADRFSAMAAIVAVLFAFVSVVEWDFSLVYTIGLLFASEYLPSDNEWIKLFVTAITSLVFYKQYQFVDTKEGSRALTTCLCLFSLLIGQSILNPIVIGTTTFGSFLYALLYLLECANTYTTRATMTTIASATTFIIFFVIVFFGILYYSANHLHTASVLSLLIVSMTLWGSPWFDCKLATNVKAKRIMSALFIITWMWQTIPFTMMTTGIKWVFGIGGAVLTAVILYRFATSTNAPMPTTMIMNSITVAKQQYATTHKYTFPIIGATAVAFASYIGAPYLYQFVNEKLQGGQLLLKEPIHINKRTVLSTYSKLNHLPEDAVDKDFNYQYGISSYIYIDANNPHDYYTTVLDYGGKPNIQYNGAANSLRIVMLDDYQQEKVVYTLPGFELQKWHHVAINYLGGNLDIFIDGELVKSVSGVVPYMKLDDLVVGQDTADYELHGGIKDVIYFDTPLTRANLFFLSSSNA